MANISTKKHIFGAIKNVILNIKNTDDDVIFKNVVMFRTAQKTNQDSVQIYPYVSCQFLGNQRVTELMYLQNITERIVLRIHIQDLDYDKLDIYTASETILNSLNFLKINIYNEIIGVLTCDSEEMIEEDSEEVVLPLTFSINYKQKNCPLTKVYNVSDFDYNINLIQPDTELYGTNGITI